MLLALLAACALRAPSAPPIDDPAFSVEGLRSWYLVPNALTAGHDAARLTVTPPAGVRRVDAWLDGAHVGTGVELTLDLSGVAPGQHELLLQADGAAEAFARRVFTRSHPLYVLVSVDWDLPDTKDAQLAIQEELHAQHPSLRITHFVGPYTFTDPEISPDRVALLVDWLERMRDTHGDEIGLHIHPYCSFVELAGLPCVTSPSFATADGDPTGYTVGLDAYGEQEMVALLGVADDLFVARGLGKPVSFRAGGWTAVASTLRALDAAGYRVDTSANNWRRMDEWDGVPGATLYEWNAAHWGPIGDTSQPWHPDPHDALAIGDLGLLEVPDNGILLDYVDGAEMIQIFDANWPGGALVEPRAWSIGYHNTVRNVHKAYLHQALDHADDFLAEDDAGPVVYGRVGDMAEVWP